VIRSKSPAVTPFIVNLGAQCEIAIVTRSSTQPPRLS
jgi:ABC-type hemin transport system substrate-binding protein